MTTEQKAAVVPTGEGITETQVVKPPWWDDPQEAHRETVRLLGVIAGELSTLNRRIMALEQRIPTGLGLGSLLRPIPRR